MLKWVRQLFAAADASAEAPAPSGEHAAQGKAQLAKGNFTDAVGHYRAAIATQPDDAMLHLNLGFALKEAGRASEARASLQQTLLIKPDLPDPHYLLGSLAAEQGDETAAISHWRHTLALAPDFEIAYLDLCRLLLARSDTDAATILLEQGLAQLPQSANLHFFLANLHYMARQAFAEATGQYRAAVTCEPGMLPAWRGLFAALQAQGLHADAIAAYREALPHFSSRTAEAAELHIGLGVALHAAGEFGEAAGQYRRALAVSPGNVDALYNMGVALHAVQAHQEASDCYRAVLEQDPRHVNARFNLAQLFAEQERREEAFAAYQEILEINPAHVETHVAKGNLSYLVGKYEDAVASYRNALEIKPGDAGMLRSLGTSFYCLGRFTDAEDAYYEAIAARPGDLDLRMDLVSALYVQCNLEQTIAMSDEVIRRAPQHPGAHFAKAQALLARGDFDAGWRAYESRWEYLASIKPPFPQPEWDGVAELRGKTILIYAEQGYGDTLQFIRYASLLAQRGARVLVLAPHPLQSLLATCPGVAQVFATAESVPYFDLHCALMSLPFLLGTQLHSIPAAIPYLHSAEEKQVWWKNKLGPRDPQKAMRVGVAWAGNPRKHDLSANAVDRMRSMHIRQWLPLLEVPGVEFLSLQLGDDAVDQLRQVPRARERILDYTADLHDFEDTAALVSQLDLVISVDTSIVHLVGAVGKPLWMLDRHNSCWRWLTGREDSPWYPSVRLFRQPSFGDWDSIMNVVVKSLAELAASCRVDAP